VERDGCTGEDVIGVRTEKASVMPGNIACPIILML
jgi:hypothetical protein